MKKLKLTQGKYALVDDEDYARVSKLTWCCHRMKKVRADDIYYAATNIKVGAKYKTVHLHRFIAGMKKGKDIDHINNNGLDNRRKNLRVCSRSVNLLNARKMKGTSSKYKCVYKIGKKWKAEVSGVYLGMFFTELRAYNETRTYKLSLI